MPNDRIGPGGTEPRHAHREEVAATLPSQEDLFERLLTDLAESGEVHVVEPGVVRFVEGSNDGDAVEIHVTPPEWREYVIKCEMVARQDSGVDTWGPGDGLICDVVGDIEAISGQFRHISCRPTGARPVVPARH